MKYCYCLHLRQSIKNTIEILVKGQEITFHGNILFKYDLFPEIEIFSDNSVLDLVFIPGCMSLRISETKKGSLVNGIIKAWCVIIFFRSFSCPHFTVQ